MTVQVSNSSFIFASSNEWKHSYRLSQTAKKRQSWDEKNSRLLKTICNYLALNTHSEMLTHACTNAQLSHCTYIYLCSKLKPPSHVSSLWCIMHPKLWVCCTLWDWLIVHLYLYLRPVMANMGVISLQHSRSYRSHRIWRIQWDNSKCLCTLSEL